MAVELLADLRSKGIVLSIDGDGRLAFDAPAGVIDEGLMESMRAQRDELLAQLYDEQLLLPMPGVLCPWCRSDRHLMVVDSGLWCGNCRRDAWRFEEDSIVRADWEQSNCVVVAGALS